MPKKKIGKELTEWYDKSHNFNKKYFNPSYENIGISHCFRGILLGGSGSGKSRVLLEIIYRLQNTFGKIILCTQDKSEALYEYLKSKIEENLIIHEGYQKIPTLSETNEKFPKEQVLIIFDDMVGERKQDKIRDYFVRGRKSCHGISCLYLSQSYFQTPKLIRLQLSFLVMKKLTSTRDLNFILSDFNLGVDRDTLHQLYKYCIDSDHKDFLFIDVNAPFEKRFRKNFHEILNVTGESDEES